MKFDELNKLKGYFSKMRLTPEEIEKRVSLGGFFYDAFFYVLTLMYIDSLINEDLDREFYISILQGRLIDALVENDITYEESYIQNIVEDVIDMTIEHYSEEEYFSDERALNLAQDNTNATCDNADYIAAVKQGKRTKTWYTEEDEAVRPAHREVNNKTIGIDDYFYVDGELLRFPHDRENGTAKNLARCRCTIHYD